VFEKGNDQELSEENRYARLSHSKHLLKNIHPTTLASFLFIDENTSTVATRKPHRTTRSIIHLQQREGRRDKTLVQI